MNRRRLTGHGRPWRQLAVGLLMAIAILCWPAVSVQAQILPATEARLPELTVYRSPTCRCCEHWVDHMKAAGFQVQSVVTDAMAAIKDQYGVPADMTSCHTAIADGYGIEGHVPAADVMRLLRDRPEVLGLAAPGMPVGAPGMETGDRVDPYTVFSFTQGGAIATFAEHS